MDKLTANMLTAIRGLQRNRYERKYGIVADDSPFTVTIGGTDRTDCRRLGTYTPTIGDKVLCTRSGQEPWLVHGDVIDPSGS